ncbi:MAG: helicase HerA-like domain-containing protein [Anaerolineae bacterium]
MTRIKGLRISPDLTLPLDFITQTAAILAKRRVGKSYTASVIAEEMVKAGLPWVAIDPTGAWWGLRASSDGEAEGLPVVILGGAHADVPLEPTAGKVIADLVVDHPGWYVIDLSGFDSQAEQDRFSTDFGWRLFYRKQKSRAAMHLFIDEADSVAPQRPFHGQEKMLGAYEAIVRRGGVYGIGCTLITQRPSVLNKNVLTQSENLIVLRITSPQDQKAVRDWVSNHGEPDQVQAMMGGLASLGTGEQSGPPMICSTSESDITANVNSFRKNY